MANALNDMKTSLTLLAPLRLEHRSRLSVNALARPALRSRRHYRVKVCGPLHPYGSAKPNGTVAGSASPLGLPRPETKGIIVQRTQDGWGSGLIGVIIFSGSLPATRVAVGGFSPLFLTSARAVIAALLGAALLLGLRQKRPTRRDLVPLAIVALGVVIGFPLLTAQALRHITSAHSIVFIGLLPLTTAIFGVLRGGERPKPAFWLFSTVGGLAVAGFALTQSGRASLSADVSMVAAVILCGLGYAEGATLSRRLGGWQVISWSLVLACPIMAAIAFATLPRSGPGSATRPGSASPMCRCSACWSASCSGTGVSRSAASRASGNCNCSSRSSGWGLAALLLGEPVGWPMVAVSGLVVLCVAGAKRFA